MFVAWVGLAPVGAWVARYRRVRFASHWYILFAALGLTLLGLALGVAYVALSGRTQFNTPHAALGLAFVLLSLLQAALGWYIHVRRTATGAPRPLRNTLHRSIGLLALLTAVPTLVLGFLRYGSIYQLPEGTFYPALFIGASWVLAWLVGGEAWGLADAVVRLKASKKGVQVVVVDGPEGDAKAPPAKVDGDAGSEEATRGGSEDGGVSVGAASSEGAGSSEGTGSTAAEPGK
ncbi:hypothetical protein DFJ74DRAFT_688701 [Hyaloraphidium curvatum]|nr:hypothetical protein DFJ74DRAFT_688701 [Hyaloraphidium curvatum]